MKFIPCLVHITLLFQDYFPHLICLNFTRQMNWEIQLIFCSLNRSYLVALNIVDNLNFNRVFEYCHCFTSRRLRFHHMKTNKKKLNERKREQRAFTRAQQNTYTRAYLPQINSSTIFYICHPFFGKQTPNCQWQDPSEIDREEKREAKRLMVMSTQPV